MFRFLHTADVHLDSPMIGLSSREGAAVDAMLGAANFTDRRWNAAHFTLERKQQDREENA